MNLRTRLGSCTDLIPIAFMVVFSFYFSLEVPASDDWDLVPVINKMQNGSLDWNTIDTPYVGHKVAIPYLTLSGIAIATHWNTWAFRTVNILFFLGAWLAIRPAAVREGRLFATAMVFWSWNQWAAWVFTATMYCTIAIFFALWSLRLLESRRWINFAAGTALAVLATFSFGAGLAAWPAGLYLLFIKERPLGQKIVYVAVMLLALFGFVHHPALQGNVQAQYVRGNNILHMPVYFLIGLGAPVAFPTLGLSAVAALGGFAMLAFSKSCEKLRDRPYAAAILLASLAMMGLLMIARGGGSYLIGGADSRYGTIAALFWVAVVLLADWNGFKRYALATLMALCAIRDATRIPGMVAYKHHEEEERLGLLQWTPQRFTFIGAQTTPAKFDADAKLLRQWHYSLFRDR